MKKTINNFRNDLNDVMKEKLTCNVFFIMRNEEKESKFELKLADIENKEATGNQLKELFLNNLKEEILDNSKLSVIELSSADERKNVIYQYDYEEYPEELKVVSQFDIEKVLIGDEKVEKFNFNNDNLKKIFGYIIYIGSMEKGMVLFKKQYPYFLINRETFLLKTIKSKSRFVKYEDGDLLRLNGNFHVMRINNEIYISNLKVIEKNLGFTKLIMKDAKKTIDCINSINIVEDIQVLNDEIDDISFIRSMGKIYKNSKIITNKISKDQILNFIKNKNSLKDKFKYTEDGKKIRLDTKKSKKEFIKLLNDNFLHSELTGEDYDVIAKDNLQVHKE